MLPTRIGNLCYDKSELYFKELSQCVVRYLESLAYHLISFSYFS